MDFKPFCNTEIIFLSKEAMKEKLLSLSATYVVLVMSESSAVRWNMAPFIEALRTKYESVQGTLTWIKKVASNPTQRDVSDALQQIGDCTIDLIFAFGGGSAIDIAKGISAFHGSSYDEEGITQSIKQKHYKEKIEFADIVAIPSTAGTGSEVTQWATIWDVNKTGKFSIDDPRLKPKMSLIVPELTLTLSSKLTLSTGLDAMSHALEAYWSKHTTPLVQEISYRAVEIIIKNLKTAVEQPYNISVRKMLCKASVLAGLAFSQTRTTACHSISYPLTILFDMPHGLAAAITLNAIGKINKGHFLNDDELFSLFEGFDGSIKNWIDNTCEGVIDLRLSAFGVAEKDIETVVDRAFTGGRMANNPVDLSVDDVAAILRSVL